ncbi:ECF transporter S component [Bombilactobacillus folatiphilus]|uniref:Riboflavin transporter n=1 Tax=Bombilactobacillus folatiphilus TaxID=2923362 RepID=A0ABY4PAS1_9LACO|nr:ECF transporter S component [Bombilactobacillus folatiphilus]UQS82772.1 ECF transporter S component [Bombilactobacillus folatiphilus]
MERNKLARNKLIGGGILAALAALIMFIGIPIIPGFSFLKLDFSDVVVLLAFYLYGMSTGTLVALCKVLVHWLLTGMGLPGIIGDFSSLVSSLAFIIPIILLLQHHQKPLLAYTCGTLSLTIFLSLANYFILMPIYMAVLNFNIGMPIAKYVLYGVIPFNLVKGVILSILSILLTHRLKLLKFK